MVPYTIEKATYNLQTEWLEESPLKVKMKTMFKVTLCTVQIQRLNQVQV
jgi:hypothetical protein